MTPLVAREAELATVRAAVIGGAARAVVITGPAGVGKSRLVQEAVTDTTAVRAMASPVAPVPFGVVRDLVTVDSGDNRAATVRAYVAALRRRPEPAVIVEDLHWADADSLAVLVDLARAPDGPVLLATSRDEPHRTLVDTLAALSSTPSVTMLTLTGLSTGGVAALIESIWHHPVPVRTALHVRRRTDGLPYWVEELARVTGTPTGLAHAALPGMAGAALRSRVDTAGDDAVRVAEPAAVLGERVDLDLLAKVLNEPVADLLPALRRLVAAWVLEEVEPDLFAFRHALTREAVAEQVPQAMRRQWHSRAYEVLRERDATDPVLAWHAAGAALTAETAEHARRGAESLLAAGSGAEALRMAELALEAGAQPVRQVHELAARAAYTAGWIDEAETHAAAWRETATGDEAADAQCLLSLLRWHAGDLTGHWAALREALAVLGDARAPSPARARVHAAMATALLRAERRDDAVAEADRAIAAAELTGEQAARRNALIDKATALAEEDRTSGLTAHPAQDRDPALRAAALELFAEAERACEDAGDVITLGRALNNSLPARMADRPAAEQWAVWDATWQRAARLGLHPSLGKIVRQGIDLAYRTGHWDRGWQAVTTRLPEETDPVERVVLAAKAALLALEADRIEEAAWFAERSTAAATGMDQFWALLYVALVDVALASRTAPAATTVRALGRYRVAVAPTDHAKRPHRAVEVAQWALDGGVAAPAVRAFLATTLPDGLPEVLSGGTELMLAEAGGDDRAAARAGHDALTQAHWQHRYVVHHADSLTRLGRSLLRTGRAADAGELADQACALLAAWPGRRRAAAQALARAAAAAGPDLTPRERQIRDMISEGLSNREIAERCGISPRTVAVHVSRLLTKTGATSRTELAVAHLRRD